MSNEENHALEALKMVPLFSELRDEVLEKLTLLCQLKSFQKDQVILIEEEKGDSFFIIDEGSVKVTRLSEDGREAILAFLYEGDFFGELSLLDGEARSANVIAMEKTIVNSINRNDFLDMLEKHPSISIALLRELAQRLRRSDQHIEFLTLSDAEGKLASILLELAEQHGVRIQGRVTISFLPSQQDLANIMGTTRETVSRMMKKLEVKNWIERDMQKVVILDYEKFREKFQTGANK
jgi:CRP/FNR family transcriptional regulator, cyclic AMP receptor protein